jgi:predicted NUDIX family phosphoesterase
MPTDERVLCIPTAHFQAVGAFHGFHGADAAYGDALLDPTAYTFRPRSEVETDPAFKQLIPYVVLRCGGELFHYRRGAAGTEKRLQALRSVGIGGHISEADAADGADPYRTGMLREVAEEVKIGCLYAGQSLGFINDDRTFVGSVHLGVVHLFELESPAATPREDALAESGFAPVSELWNERAEFETWSQFVLEEVVRRFRRLEDRGDAE